MACLQVKQSSKFEIKVQSLHSQLACTRVTLQTDCMHCRIGNHAERMDSLPSLNLGSEIQVAKDIFQRDSDGVAGEDVEETERAFRNRAG